jgi:4,5-DOPA dioxygenase extradiol
VLVIGSGFTTHGLPFLSGSDFLGQTLPGWSMDFDVWAEEQLARGDVDAPADYRERDPGMPYAHPTVEHFVPLFVTLGAASEPEAPRESTIDGFWMGLSKRSLQVA